MACKEGTTLVRKLIFVASSNAGSSVFEGAVVLILDGTALGGDALTGNRIVLLLILIVFHAGVAGIAVYPLEFISD